MSCETVHQILEQGRDEQLPPLVRSALSSHVASCPDCARLVVLEDALAEGLAALREQEASLELPASFRRQVKERLLASDRRQASSGLGWTWGWTGGLAAAACLTIAVVATLALREGRAPELVAAGVPVETHQQPVALRLPEPATLDLSTAPLLYATPEVEVFYGGPRADAMRPASATPEPETDSETEDEPRRREYHF